MNGPSSDRRLCAKCGKQNGIMICDGCQSVFCSRHIAQHRQELSHRLEILMDDRHQFHENILRFTSESFQFQKIDRWEKDSIRKIRFCAETARNELREIIQQTKRRLKKVSQQMANHLVTSYKTDNFSENELNRWAKQLRDLRTELSSINTVELSEEKQSPLFMIRVNQKSISGEQQSSRLQNYSTSPEDIFHKASSSIVIEENGTRIKHIGQDLDYGNILGQQTYSKGRHSFTFRIEHFTSPYMIFFGGISTQRNQKLLHYTSIRAVGWFGYNEIYQHGTWSTHAHNQGYRSDEIEEKDLIDLIFDCDQKQMEFHHQRTQKIYALKINTEKAPLPWQLFVVLTHTDDCVTLVGQM